ncbi:MurR/RpiR family transcriptional regulator [uncultured Cohaesibacter sp.]|uniref:MurR/RpiR family transcriptional regulator n=1 Tax=uncultured Cohaesibacter sp. TaxID=1002546 RepID=UPI0029C8E299|nr:MurR/RpiR family transcriptional regulator [uncultured Cohaesibacter sp.]
MQSIEDRISGQYSQLSERLKQAADFVVDHEIDVATHSLRTVSAMAGLAPSTFTRLSQALGFASYEEMRDVCRARMGRQALSFSERASLLVRNGADDGARSFFEQQSSASLENLGRMERDLNQERLVDVVEQLNSARQVLLFGAFSSTGFMEYFGYLARYFADNWKVIGRMGASLSSAMVGLNDKDVVVVLTMAPYARRAIVAAEMAADAGAYVLVITDDIACPALSRASASFIVPTESPQFFSSYAATLVLIETIVGMLVARAGDSARARIEEVENRNRQYGEFWD